MKKILLILSGILFCFTGISQSVAPQVYATSGGHYTGTNAQLSWTIGEPVIE
ncbi:MAG: hypothetical protein IIA88_10535, partial [Bacteroidetes bacterium]|nr:hypothetical protein [Bacteroidota bacterium]